MTALTEYLQNVKEKETKPMNSEREYVQAVKDLWAHIDKWLEEPKQKGLVGVFEVAELIREERTPYYVPGRFILIPGTPGSISFRPRGQKILNADGWIEVRGDKGIASLLYKRGEGVIPWKISRSSSSQRPEPVNEESFTELLKSLIG